MSRLEIADLSFCETEFENSGKVQGGRRLPLSPRLSFNNFLLPVEESELEILEESVGKNGEKMRYFFDKETDSSGVVMLKETDSSRTMVSTVVGSDISGERYSSSFVFSSSYTP